MDSKVKIYKNPDRSKPEQGKSYVPQYQLRGIEPEEYNGNGNTFVGVVKTVVSAPQSNANNPRMPRPMIRQPYAEAVSSPVGRSEAIPNVGNNIEHVWSNVDDEIIDDMPENIDPNTPMIDNNDYVDTSSLSFGQNMQIVDPYQSPMNTEPEEQDFFGVARELGDDDHLLIVQGEMVCSGPLKEIEEHVSALVFGEHDTHKIVSINDIVVLKKIAIKMGVFLK